MSDVETHRGKLIPLSLEGDTLEEQAKDACRHFGFNRESYHESWLACLNDEGYKRACVIDNVIYKVEDTELDPYGFAFANKNEDGTIDYFINYYNGGASFNEVLDDAIKKDIG